jgi:ribosome-associated translation inhibitor RaiA
MRIDITGQRNHEMEPLHDYVTRRLRFVLSRFGGQIVRVGVRLVRLPTVAGEPCLGCRLTIRLVSGQKVLAEVSHTGPLTAIDQAVERSRRLVGLRLVNPRAGASSGTADVSSPLGTATSEPIDYLRRRKKKGVGSGPVAVNKKVSMRS